MKQSLQLLKNVIIILVILPLLSSCSKEISKDAYCFSVVFERTEAEAKISMYCKTSDSTNDGSMKNVTLTFEDKDFRRALKKADTGKYNIYFNSIQAYYLSGNLSSKDLREITLLLLDNGKYKTDNNSLHDKTLSSEALHNYAKTVCDSEGILRNERKIYSSSIDVFRMLF